jgi:hypothetical protein
MGIKISLARGGDLGKPDLGIIAILAEIIAIPSCGG